MGGRGGARGGGGGGGGGGGKRPEERTPTEIAASRAGVTAVDNDGATALGRDAADTINGQRRSGYTVYGTTHYSGPGKSYGGVGYGAGETAGAIASMRKILRNSGFNVAKNPDGGLLVGRK